VFQSRPQSDDVTGNWRKFHSEELNDLYSPNIIRVLKSVRWVGYVAHVREIRGAEGILVGKPEGNDTTWKTQA
jgi:hypothetical protein